MPVVGRDNSVYSGEPFAGCMQSTVKLGASYCPRGRFCCAIGPAKVDKISWIHQKVLCVASIGNVVFKIRGLKLGKSSNAVIHAWKLDVGNLSPDSGDEHQLRRRYL